MIKNTDGTLHSFDVIFERSCAALDSYVCCRGCLIGFFPETGNECKIASNIVFVTVRLAVHQKKLKDCHDFGHLAL